MKVIFEPKEHKYIKVDDDGCVSPLTSVTTLLSLFKKPFDKEKVASKISKDKKSKWHGLDPKVIISIWDAEAKRATDLGSWYHDQRENDLLAFKTIEKDGVSLPIVKSVSDEYNRKIAPEQRLKPGVYPEHFVYLISAGISGQIDRLEIVNDKVNIIDYKTNKEIKTSSYVNWEGISQKLAYPLDHLDDCNFYHYALQLSLYMYIVLKHNPKYDPGEMYINHIVFEEEEEKDEWGYPQHKLDAQGNFIVKEIIPYKIPYLKKEVIDILKWFEVNRDNINLKKNNYDKII